MLSGELGKLAEQSDGIDDGLRCIHGHRPPDRPPLRHRRGRGGAGRRIVAMEQVTRPAAPAKVVDGHRFLGVERPLQQRLQHRRQLLEPVRTAGQGEAVLVPAPIGVPEDDHPAGRVQRVERPAEQQVGGHLPDVAGLNRDVGRPCLPGQVIHRSVLLLTQD